MVVFQAVKFSVWQHNGGYVSPTMSLSKLIECVTQSVLYPNVNRGLYIIIMCHYRLIRANQCTKLTQDTKIRGKRGWEWH